MLDMETLYNKILYMITQDEKCIKKAVQSKVFLKLFEDDEMSLFVAKQFVKWYLEFKTLPSKKKIHDDFQASDIGPKVHMKFKMLAEVAKLPDPPTENEFDSYVNDLKMAWMQSKFTENLNKYTGVDANKNMSLIELSKSMKSFGDQFVKLSDSVLMDDEGEYSFTTGEVAANIDQIKNKDISKERRFRIGHRKLDNETNGFRYGDFVIILGNINQGKSMVVSNVVYNVWKDGGNVLLLTAEHKASEFDERIYSRASNVDYKAIMNGAGSLTVEDKAALDECIAHLSSKPNKIITKFLKNSDNVGTIEGYIEDLRLKHDFVPDVIVLDSLEKISPLNTIIEDKDHLKVAEIAKEFKNFAQTSFNHRGCVVISTHQAKTETFDKHFDEISVTDFGRSKVVAEEPDFALYIRSKKDFNLMNVKLIKARRTAAGLTWTMAIDFSKVLVADTDDSLNAEMLPDD